MKKNSVVEVSCPKCGDIWEVKYRGRPSIRLCMSCQNLTRGWSRKHGGDGTRLYKIWVGMRQRCSKPYCVNYPNYGGRGITVCKEWDKDFVPFRDWSLANGYGENLQIDRINNDGNYEPSNCQWATCKQNQRNRRSSRFNVQKVKAVKVLHDNGWMPCQIAELIHEDAQYISTIIRPYGERDLWRDVKPDYMSMVSGC